MAYDRTKLQRVGPQNRNGVPSLFCYADEDSNLTAIDASGYFNDASDILKVGDCIFANAANGFGIYVCNSNTRDLAASPPVQGVVDVSNAVALGAIDSD